MAINTKEWKMLSEYGRGKINEIAHFLKQNKDKAFTNKELCDRFGSSIKGMYHMTHRLVKRGLIKTRYKRVIAYYKWEEKQNNYSKIKIYK